MRGKVDPIDLLFDPEITRSEKRNRRRVREKSKSQVTTAHSEDTPELPIMAANNEAENPLMDSILTPAFNRPNSSIVQPGIDDQNWELKSSIIQLVERAQFGGEEHEDPHRFIDRFLMICDSTKHPRVTDDAIRLRLFPFAVKGEALSWLERQPARSIATWNDLSSKFFSEFFSMERYNQMVNDITNFTQLEGETMCAAWNRFKDLMRRCPHYNLSAGDQVRIFFNGSTPEDRRVLNGAAGGTIKTMRANETLELIERMARNENQGLSSKSKRGSLHLEGNGSLLSQQIAGLTSRLDKMQIAGVQAKSVAVVCDYCQNNHAPNECPSLASSESPQQMQVNGIWYDQRPQQSNFQRNQNFSGGGGNNFQQRTQGAGMDFKPNNSYAQPSQSQLREPAEWEKAFAQMAKTSNEMAHTTNAFMEETRAQIKNTNASVKNLENQIGQLAKQVSERIPGTFPSNTVTNPKEDCMAIITRSGKVVAPLKTPNSDCVEEEEKQNGAVEPEAEVESNENEKEKEVAIEEDNVKEEPAVVEKKHELSPEYIQSKAPYPERFKKEAYNKHYGRFLDIFKKLHINIPFAEALASMPGYSKFMKDLLSRKHKLQECQTVTLTEKCSAFIQQKVPPKLSDPGSFNIPMAIGDTAIGTAMCDLGASINLMPLSVYKSLGINELKPTEMSLQLADRSVRTPNGILEDVLVKIDKFIFPADFVVLDMEEGSEKPLLVGRPFLRTARALIDMEKGTVKLRMNDQEITYNVSDFVKRPAKHKGCFQIEGFHTMVEQKKSSSKELANELKAFANFPFEEEEVHLHYKASKQKVKVEKLKSKGTHPEKKRIWCTKVGSSLVACFNPP